MIHIRSDYTKTRSKFYGPSLGCSYERCRACRDPLHVAPTPRLLSLPSWSVVLLTEVEKSPQLSIETRHTIADNMQRRFLIACVTLYRVMTKPPSLPHDTKPQSPPPKVPIPAAIETPQVFPSTEIE